MQERPDTGRTEMTDKELLELAAKAAGYDVKPHGNAKRSRDLHFTYRGTNWNPLTDDGDALRLAVKLGMKDYFSVEVQTSCVQATALEPWEHCEYEEYKTQDPYAATRRAIVRAAAEMGKNNAAD